MRRRAAHQPAQATVRLARPIDQPVEGAHRRAFGGRPVGERVEIRREMRGGRSLDREAEVAPHRLAAVREIVVLDVEAADQRVRRVGERELLVVAQQVASPDAGQEADHAPPGRDQRGEEVVVGVGAAEAIDQQRDADAAATRLDRRVAHASTRGVGRDDVVEQAQLAGRAVDQRDQRREPRRALGQDRQPVAVDVVRVVPHRDGVGRADDGCKRGAFLDAQSVRA